MIFVVEERAVVVAETFTHAKPSEYFGPEIFFLQKISNTGFAKKMLLLDRIQCARLRVRPLGADVGHHCKVIGDCVSQLCLGSWKSIRYIGCNFSRLGKQGSVSRIGYISRGATGNSRDDDEKRYDSSNKHGYEAGLCGSGSLSKPVPGHN